MFGTGLQKSTAILLGIKVTDFEGKIYCKAYLPTVDSVQPNVFGVLPKKIECDPIIVGQLKDQNLPVSQFGYLAEISYSFKSASKDSLSVQIHAVKMLGYYDIDENFQPSLKMLLPANHQTNGPAIPSAAVPSDGTPPVSDVKSDAAKDSTDKKTGRNFS